jgi:hypothetical protein
MPLAIGQRELIGALGSAAAWPFSVRAERPEMPVKRWRRRHKPGGKSAPGYCVRLRQSVHYDVQCVIIWFNCSL